MNTASPRGLSQAQVTERLARDGPNVLPAARRSTLPALIGEVVREPMFSLLLAAGALYLLLGDLAEASILVLFATLSVSIAVIQRGRSERVLEALQDLTSPRALVIRDGEHRRIEGREVVVGDLMVLGEGDRIAADAILLSGIDVRVAEALLTGESVPVRKEPAAALAEDATTADESSMVYCGTLQVGGSGLARVVATGTRTQLGRLGASMREIEPEVPHLQRQTRRLVLIFAILGGLLSIAVVPLYGLRHGDWIQALLGGIALGMAMLPEEFPLVLTVFMVMGAWRLSRSRVLTRRATAIETLGAATVLCTDKTGTLTHNRMSVVSLEADGASWTPADGAAGIAASAALAQLLGTAAAASEPQGHDPMDVAVTQLAAQAGVVAGGLELVRTWPLRRELLAVAMAWREPGSTLLQVAAKGAPEAILRLCRLDGPAGERVLQQVDQLARAGTRVLAVARGTLPDGELPEDAAALALQFKGLTGFADPLRESVPAALQDCHTAGIRVVMITGDYPETAQAIARSAGFQPGDVLTGQELEQLDDAGLARRVATVTVFARITPAQKLRIVNAFKANGEVVAMTGDGVNDAPALKAAHIGIAMGGRGTDVAREASSLVLLEDDFGSIVRAIRLGRRIYGNLRKALSYILAVHVPIAGLALLPLLTGAPLVLTPLLIALMELIIDPTCSIVFEAEHSEEDAMRRPPRRPDEPLVTPRLAWSAVLQGILALLVVTLVYVYARSLDLADGAVRFTVFLALAASSFALLLANRSDGASLRVALGGGNPALPRVAGATAALLALLALWPVTRHFFAIELPGARQFALSLGAGVVLFLVLEAIKVLRRAGGAAATGRPGVT